MKKRLLFFLIVLLLPFFVTAQRYSQNNNSIELNGKKLELPDNFKSIRKGFKKSNPSEGYFILQFNEIPTIDKQRSLKAQGITLHNYLQANAYFVRISSPFYSIGKRESKNIRSFMPIKPEYKIDQFLVKGNIPEHARVDNGYVKVVIRYFKDEKKSAIKEQLSNFEVRNLRVVEIFNKIEVEVPITEIPKIATLDCIWVIQPIDPPAEFENDHGRTSYRANILNSTIRGLGYGLTGKGVKVGLWDGDVENHRDFNDRVTVREAEVHGSDHGTHVCGTITGSGLIDPIAQGMATEANVYSWNFNTQSNGLSVPEERVISLEEDSIEITSNSWGIYVRQCPSPYGYYGEFDEDYVAREYPYFLYVFSAGNDQSQCPDGYRTTSKNIKNSLVVAALDKQDNMSSFSSFGPTFHGRLIPNISGDGVNTYSTFFDNGYGYMSGTSMATPGVAGTMALIYQRYKDTHGGERPLAVLMRALALNTAYDMGNPGPDYKYGYGAINGVRAIEVMEQNNYFIDSVSNKTYIEKDITVPSGVSALRVFLAWNDIPDRYLVNDLDLSVFDGTTTVLPWVLNPNNPSANAFRDYEWRNNMEQVTISNPVSGTYTIRVDGYEVTGVQDFAIVYDIVMPELKMTYPIGGEYLTPGYESVIRWDCEGYDSPFTLEYSPDSGINYTIVASNIPSDSRSYLWNVPVEITRKGKFRISNGSILNESKGVFHIMDVPQNVNVASAQCGGAGPFTLQWDAVSFAKYEVLKLNGQVYEHLAEVTGTSYDITNITNNNNNWYCVRAIDLATGAKSERSLAVNVNPAEAIVSLPFSEDFETQEADNFYFSSINGQGNVRYVTDAQGYGIRLEGTSGTTTDWVDATGAACFSSNPDYVVTAGICNFDATSFAGKVFRLKFDYRQKYLTAVGTSYFIVKVNGDTLVNTEGTKIYGTTDQVSYKTVYYDLTAYAGLASVNVEFEAVCKTNYITYVNSNGSYDFSNDTYDKGDFVTIDNIELFEPEDDISSISLDLGTGLTSSETITFTVKNLSGSSVSNIPVSYTINNGTPVLDTIKSTIATLEEISHPFSQSADFSASGYYDVNASINWSSDSNAENNTFSASIVNNGDDLLLGSVSSTNTCNATFTDPEGRYLNYAMGHNYVAHTIFPDAPGKNVKITFTEFSVEAGYDYLYVYDGPDYNAPYLGRYDGNTLPPSFISSANNGELTFYFYSDNYVSEPGFVATLECEDKPSADPALIAVTSPVSGVSLSSTETVSITLKNYGIQDLTNVNVYYAIDNGTPVTEVIPALDSLQEMSYSFTTLADLSVVDTFKIVAWVDTTGTGDTNLANNKDSIEVINSAINIDAGISSVNDIIPLRENLSALDVEITNQGNQNIGNFDIAYTINGGAEVTQTIVGPIVAGATLDTTFSTLPDLTAGESTYVIKVYTKLAGDALADNDSLSTEINTPAIATTNVVGTFLAGTKNVVIAGTNASIDLTNDYTIECWVNLGAPATYGHVFNKTNISLWYHTGAGSYYYGDNSFILSVVKASGSFTFYVPNTVKVNTWQHIALTVTSSNVYTLYVDGVAQSWTVYSGTAGATKTNADKPLYIGNRATDLARSTSGYIDEFRIWDSSLDQPTIMANMMTNYPVNVAGMLAYYKFKEGNGKYVYDYSSNDNTAIVYNGDVSGTGEGKFWNTPGFLLKGLNFTGEKIPTTFDAGTSTFNSIMDGANLSNLAANFSAQQQSLIKVSGLTQVTGVTTNDFSLGSVAYVAEGTGFNTGISQNYSVNVTNDLSSDCELTAYTFEMADNPGLSGQIELVQSGNNFDKKLAYGSDVSSLKASFTVSANAKLYINDVEQTSPQALGFDYSDPLMVKVLSENGRVFKNYRIYLDTRNTNAELTAFNILDEQVGTTDMNVTAHTADVWVKNSSDVSALTPSFAVSPEASVYVNNVTQLSSLTTNDFTDPVIYTVVSEDETKEFNWTATVTNDLVKPVISLIGDDSVNVYVGEIYTDGGATATDNADGDLTSSIVVINNVNTATVGLDTVKYNVTDAAGNEAEEVIRKVNTMVQLVDSITVKGTGNAITITTLGGSLQMIAEVLPENATDKNVSWSVANGTGEATIDTTGMLKAVKDGTVTVTATADDGSGITGSLVITISNQGTFVNGATENVISISPNPAKDKIKIEIGEVWSKLIMYNSIGIAVKTTEYKNIVDISDLPAGLYLIKIYDKDNKPYPVKELIIQ